MTDLLDELRRHEREYQSLVHGPLCGQAADEIERLSSLAQGSSGSPSDFIRDSLREAMTDAWNDICSDTDCHPLDIDRQGKRLFFKPGHWADAIAMHLTSALANHSAFADLMASGGLNDTPTDDQQIVDQINYLRGGEGDSVTILCDNPDFNGQPNCAVECNGDWTRWEDRRYTGDTLLDALNAAWLECHQWRTALDYGREKWPPAAPRTPAEGELPNARNRIEARDKLIETLEAENTRLVVLVERAQWRPISTAPQIVQGLAEMRRGGAWGHVVDFAGSNEDGSIVLFGHHPLTNEIEAWITIPQLTSPHSSTDGAGK